MISENIKRWTEIWMEEGFEKGRVEGHAEGHAEGRRQEALASRAEATLSVLRARFGEVPGEVERGVLGIDDLDALTPLLPLAATAPSIEVFREALAELPAP